MITRFSFLSLIMWWINYINKVLNVKPTLDSSWRILLEFINFFSKNQQLDLFTFYIVYKIYCICMFVLYFIDSYLDFFGLNQIYTFFYFLVVSLEIIMYIFKLFAFREYKYFLLPFPENSETLEHFNSIYSPLSVLLLLPF